MTEFTELMTELNPVPNDTYQFDDYSKYKASKYDEKHKAQVRAEQFPITCQEAFDMGVRLSSI